MLTLTLPGVTVTYYGEELGMNNTKISYEDTVDPSGCNCGPDHYADLGCSRDPERTPMQWNGMETSAGFSTTDETWLPVNPNYYEINVDTQQADPHSHLQFYKQLVQLRYRDPAFEIGAFKGSSQGNVLAFSRQAINSFYATYVTLINFDDSNSTVNFSGIFSDSVDTGSVLLSSLGMNSDHPSG
jgi:alpha-glucosidase